MGALMQIRNLLSGVLLSSLLSLLGAATFPLSPEARFGAQPQNSDEQQSAAELLNKVSEAYRGLKSYHFQIHMLTEIQSESMRKSLETDLDVSISEPAKSRIVMSGALGELQSFSDGTTTWTFLPELKQYRRRAAHKATENPEPPTDRASYLAGVATGIVTQYEKLFERVRSPKVLRKESLDFADKTVECWVVEADSGFPAEGQKTSRTCWIDSTRFLVLKEIQFTRFEASADGGPLETRITTIFKQAKIAEAFPQTWFAFDPPPGAKEVAEFRLPRASGPDLVGQEAEDFKLKDLEGREVQLQSLRGQVVLLNFWASWCGPCRLEMPVIEKLHQEFRGKGLRVFGINDEDFETISEYLREYEYTFPTLIDEDQKAARLYRVRGIPTMVVIDRQGTVSHYRVGLSRESDLRLWLRKAGVD
jgi:peroxiredoxin/outer membrane lipoprotein-sorting protein